MTRQQRLDRDTFFVGPPAAGKTTIARVVAARLQAQFHSLDDWAGLVYPETDRSAPMTDEQVDQAVELLFMQAGSMPVVWEFAHHDYVGLLTSNRFPTLTVGRKLIIVAEIGTCLRRNAVRASPVSAAYVERCWSSIQELCSLRASDPALHASTWVLDTTASSIANSVAAVMCVLNSWELQ